MKIKMLSSIQHRFDNTEKISQLSIAIILDPRFKDKFFMKAETKYLTDNSVDCVKSPRKRLRPGSSSTATDTTEDDDTSSTTSSSKIWECLTELLEEVGATSDTCIGVEAMVDRYLSEPLIDCKKVIL